MIPVTASLCLRLPPCRVVTPCVPAAPDEVQAGPQPVNHAPAVRAADGSLTVACRICEATLDLSGRMEQHVVKCHECHEATVRIAPVRGRFSHCCSSSQ